MLGATPSGSLPPEFGAPKKPSLFLFALRILNVIALFFLLITSVAAYRAAKSAGFDPGLMRRNPPLAMAKMFFTILPGVRVASVDERNGTITTEDTGTGTLKTYKWIPELKNLTQVGATAGDLNAPAPDNAKSGPSEAYHRGSSASDKLAWLPVYPGASPEGPVSDDMLDGTIENHFVFKTGDDANRVIAYYREQLQQAGLAVTLVSRADRGGLVQAQDVANKRTVFVIVGSSKEGTIASIMAIEGQDSAGATNRNPRYLGCFKDTRSRDLDLASTNAGTIESCVALCANKGLKYAGAQFGGQCFCGNQYGKYGQSNACDAKCSGNPNEICGGTYANSIYQVR